MRGEVDLIVGHFDSFAAPVRAGELVPLLQLTSLPGSALEIPRLGGPDGMARQLAAGGRTPDEAEHDAADLAAVVGAGRLIVAPRDLPGPLASCLEALLGEIIRSAEFQEAAGRAQLGIDYQDASSTHRGLLAAAGGVERFRSLIHAAIEQTRR